MNDFAIRVENLGKQYAIGKRERYHSLRDSLARVLSAPVRWLGSTFSSNHKVGNGEGAEADTIWALKDVSFEIKRGEVVGIIGRNGAGKSTLLKILSRITEPTTGEIEVRGRVGSLLEVGTGFHPELTGRENVYLNGAILGMKRAEIARKFDEIVAFAEVEKFLETAVKHYSSGMYMRLAFAVAAHLEPEILVVDEVLAVGDAEFQKKCLGKMGQVAKGGRTIFFVSHNLSAIQNLCQTVVMLRSGQMVGQGASAEWVTRYLQESSVQVRKPDAGQLLGDSLLLNELRISPAVVPCGGSTTLTVKLTAVVNNVVLDYLSVLITSWSEVRVGVIDLRSTNGPYRVRAGKTLEVDVDVSCMNLVEGEYKVGLLLVYGAVRTEFPDLALIQIAPVLKQDAMAPYAAAYRGFVEFDVSSPRSTVF